MSKRLPEDEDEFRLVDPIAEEYRLTLRAYKCILVSALADDWLNRDRPEPLGDFIARRIGECMVNAAEHGSFDYDPDFKNPRVPDEILDGICREWGLPSYQEMLAKFYEEAEADLPDVFREAFEEPHD